VICFFNEQKLFFNNSLKNYSLKTFFFIIILNKNNKQNNNIIDSFFFKKNASRTNTKVQGPISKNIEGTNDIFR